MYDKIIITVFVVPFILWGIISFVNPKFAFKYTFGNILRHQEPSKYFITNYRISGIAGIAFGLYILYRTFTTGFGN